MAKPIPVASIDCAGSSKLAYFAAHSSSKPPRTPRHRRHRTSKSSVAPSSALLSLLATIASSSTVNGSPAPPSFLCPSIEGKPVAVTHVRKRAPSSHTITYTSDDPASLVVARHVPDRYARNEDGVWRRVGSYTLYGSTVPCTGQNCRQPTHAVTTVDDQIQVGSVDQNATATGTTTDISDSLPPGWKPTARPYEGRTTLILSMSLVLAFFICFFIIGCLFWRKNLKNRREDDVEAKAKAKRRRLGATLSAEEARALASEKESKVKQKVWARATARWKANVRYTARQRRGKRTTISRLSQANLSSPSLENSRSQLAQSNSSLNSRSSSRRASIVSIPDRPIADYDSAPSSPSEEPTSTQPSPEIQAPSSPPAYHHRNQVPPIVVSSDCLSVDQYSGFSTPAVLDRSRRPSHSSICPPTSLTNFSDSRELLTPTPLHAAHVATDDKALLAGLADLASAPPDDGSADTSGASEAHVSAPAWPDEMDDLTGDLSTLNDQRPGTLPCPPSPLFPPPPSKERLAAAEFFDYSYAFDDMPTLDSEAEPSAPPFEESSAPPLENDHSQMQHTVMLPSAPPLLDDIDEALLDSLPSAPEWDRTSNLDVSGVESATGQDHDRIPSGEVAHSGPPMSTLQAPSVSGTSILPGYQP
ncbi:hypothetical protein B0H34DRAFT_15923 [Crassisporium funariophilum]|nr:hypothetical protein B0H34DRAFT_15923 [Crassisporium funariophilum]